MKEKRAYRLAVKFPEGHAIVHVTGTIEEAKYYATHFRGRRTGVVLWYELDYTTDEIFYLIPDYAELS